MNTRINLYIFLVVFLFGFLFFSNQTNAGVIYKDFYQFGGDLSNTTVHNLKFDSTGNMYAIGYFSGTVDFNPGSGVSEITSNGGEDIFIVKFDTNRDFVWVKTFGAGSNDRGYGVTFDGDDEVYITGFFASTVSFDAIDLTSVGSSDPFVGKISKNNGTVDWMYGFGGSVFSETGRQIQYEADSNKIITVGDFRDTVDFDPSGATYNLTSNGGEDIFILSLGTDGSFYWAGNIGAGSTDRAFGISTVGNKIHITGQFAGTANFDIKGGTANLTSVGSTDVFTVKYDTNADLIWAKSLGGTSGDVGYGIKVDENQHVYTVGHFQDTVDFDPGAGTENKTSAGNTDGFLLRLDENGNFIWVKTFGGTGADFIADVVVESTSAVYVNGGFQNTVDFDPGAGTENKTSAGSTDIFVVKLGYNDGDFEWVGTMGGSNSENILRIGLKDNNIYTVGNFTGNTDFDPSLNTNNKNPLGGITDGYISLITFAPYLTEVTPIGVSVYPNTLAYTFNTEEEGNISYGGSCSSVTTTTSSGNKTVNFSQLSPGTYSNCTITVTDSNGNISNTLAVSPFTIVVHSGGSGGGSSSLPAPLPTNPNPEPAPSPIPNPTPNPENNQSNTYISPIDGSSKFCPGFTKYLRKGNIDNDKNEIRLWQSFLNKFYDAKLKVDGLYGNNTERAIKNFQNNYKEFILIPWNLTRPTGYTYQSTRAYANKIIGCSEGEVILDNGKVINY